MKIKLNEKIEDILFVGLFYLLLIVMVLLVIHRFDYLQQQKSADITARNQVVNN